MSDLDKLAAKYGGTPVDLDDLAAKYGGTPVKQQTSTASGIAGAVTRGAAPVVGGAALGAALGAPLGGVGAVPGAIAGAAIGGLAGPVGDPVVSLINQVAGTRFGLPSQAIQDLLTRAGVAKPQTALEKVAEAGASGIAGSVGMTGLGSVLSKAASPVTAGVGRMLASNPGAQAAGGLGAAGASQVVANEGGAVPLQVLAGVAGGMGATRLASTKIAPVQSPESAKMQQLVADGDAANIPIATSTVLPPDTWAGRFLQSMAAKTPVIGTGPMFADHNQRRIDAVKRLADEYNISGPAPEPKVMASILEKRGDMLDKYTGYKREIAEKLGDLPVSTPKAMQAISNELFDLAKRDSGAANKLMGVIDDWANSLNGKPLSVLEKNRQEIGALMKVSGLEDIREEGEKIARRIYGPLREDIQDFVKTSGTKQDATKWMVANKRLAEGANELRNAGLKRALDKGDITPEVVDSLLRSQKPSDVALLYKSLTPQGRDEARRAVIKGAFNAYAETSPEVFVNRLSQMKPTIDGMFTGAQKSQLEGLLRVLNATKGYSAVNALPATGAQVAPLGAGVGLATVFDPMTAAGIALGGGALFRIYESAPVRNILIKISRTKPGSEAEKRLANQAVAIMQTQTEEN